MFRQAWNLHENGMLMDLIDEKLDRNECTTGELKKVIDIALMCTQSSVASWPTMSAVVVMLLSSGETVQQPITPAFIDATNRVRGDTPHSPGSSPSPATISTSLSARWYAEQKSKVSLRRTKKICSPQISETWIRVCKRDILVDCVNEIWEEVCIKMFMHHVSISPYFSVWIFCSPS